MDHLIERRGDKPRERDNVGVLLLCRIQDLVTGHHYAQIDDLEAVALEHYRDDVLPDVMHVALHRRDYDLAGAVPAPRHSGNERLQVGDGLLHDPRGLHDLRQEHLA